MDPSAVLMSALSLAATALSPVGDQAIKDGYAALKALILRNAGEKATHVETTLVKYEQTPGASADPVEHALKDAGLDQNQEVIDQAIALVRHAERLQPGVFGGQVGQINVPNGKVAVIGGNVDTINMN
jgi:hypothetical protein